MSSEKENELKQMNEALSHNPLGESSVKIGQVVNTSASNSYQEQVLSGNHKLVGMIVEYFPFKDEKGFVSGKGYVHSVPAIVIDEVEGRDLEGKVVNKEKRLTLFVMTPDGINFTKRDVIHYSIDYENAWNFFGFSS